MSEQQQVTDSKAESSTGQMVEQLENIGNAEAAIQELQAAEASFMEQLSARIGSWYQDNINDQVSALFDHSLVAATGLEERLTPLVVQLRPIWQDPLWQSLGALIVAILIVAINVWLINRARELSVSLIQLIGEGFNRLGAAVLYPFRWLQQKITDWREQRANKPSLAQSLFRRANMATKALKYLSTRREWRYNSPWYLLLGDGNSDKQKLLQGVTTGRRHELQMKEKQLMQSPSGWHFFENAVVIDAEAEIFYSLTEKEKQAEQQDELAVSNAADASSDDSPDQSENSDHSDGNVAHDATVSATQTQQASSASLTMEHIIEQKVTDIDQSGRTKPGIIRGLEQVMQLLHWYRPERPLDGVILTVSAKSLMAAAQSDEPEIALKELGNRLHRKLWLVQKEAGFIVPAWLVVTECENRSGFQSFWRAEEQNKLGQMLGWSSHHRIETQFSAAWVDEAFDQVMHDIQLVQLNAAASEREIDNMDLFMLFRQRFSALRSPLQQVAKQIFSASNYHLAPFCRGIYFTGSIADKTVFADDLFNQKIFPESRLAKPIEHKRLSANRTIRRFQVATISSAIVLSLFLVSDTLRGFFNNKGFADDLHKVMLMSPDCSASGQRTHHLLRNLEHAGEQPFYLSFPLSWFENNQHREAREHLLTQKVLNTILFKSMDCRLQQRAAEINSHLDQDLTGHRSYADVLKHWDQFTKKFEAFSQSRNVFVQLAGASTDRTTTISNLNHLLDYLYDGDVRNGVELDSSLIVGAIVDMRYQPIWMQETSRMLDWNKVIAYFERTSDLLQHEMLEHAMKNPINEIRVASQVQPDEKFVTFEPLIKAIDDFEYWLTHTRSDWVGGYYDSPCYVIHQRLNMLDKALTSIEMDQTVFYQITDKFTEKNCFGPIIKGLASMNEMPVGYLFELHQDTAGERLTVSPEVIEFHSEVVAFKSLALVTKNYPNPDPTPEAIIGWREEPVREILDILAEFQVFTETFWPGGKPFYGELLLARLQEVIAGQFELSKIKPSNRQPEWNDSFKDQEALYSQQIANFKQVKDELIQVARLLQQVGDVRNFTQVQNTAAHYANQLLNTLDSHVTTERLYLPLLLPRWQQPDFAAALYPAETDKQLEALMTTHRQRLNYLTFSYAEPLLAYLLNSQGEAAMQLSAKRWYSTVQAFADFNREITDNPIYALESFVYQDLVSMNRDNCIDKLDPVEGKTQPYNFSASGVSWFAERKVQLIRQIKVFCDGYAETQVIDRYLVVADLFNKSLAGFFPFADVGYAGRRDATPQQVERFFEQYRQSSTGLRDDLQTLANERPDLVPRSWIGFIHQLDQFDNLVQKISVDGKPVWQIPLDVEFHAYPAYSTGADQIVSWQINTGEQQAGFPNGNEQLMWQVGESMALNLRWAEGSVWQPAPNPMNANGLHLDFARQSVAATSKSPWSLFEWLYRFGATDLKQLPRLDDAEQVLAFYVPVMLKEKDENALIKPQPAKQISRANITLRATAAGDKGSELYLMSRLPQTAPGFGD